MRFSIRQLASDEGGVAATEYALLAVVIAVGIVAAVTGVGESTTKSLDKTQLALQEGNSGSGGGSGAGGTNAGAGAGDAGADDSADTGKKDKKKKKKKKPKKKKKK